MVLSANETKPKQRPSSSNKERTVQAKPLPLPPHAEIQLELQEQEMLKLERFGKILAGPTTDLGKLSSDGWMVYVTIIILKLIH